MMNIERLQKGVTEYCRICNGFPSVALVDALFLSKLREDYTKSYLYEIYKHKYLNKEIPKDSFFVFGKIITVIASEGIENQCIEFLN